AVVAKDAEFSGSLQRVTRESISILRTDGTLVDARLPATGDLSAGTIVARYNLADEVQITRKSNLELKSLRLLRRPSTQQLARVPPPSGGRKKKNLWRAPPPAASTASKPIGAGQVELERARRVSLERAANMPNFVADETANRYISRRTNPPAWRLLDTI